MIGVGYNTDMNTDTSNNQPTHDLFLVQDGKEGEDQSFWKQIGAAWPHRDGKGFGIRVDGRLVIRERKEKTGANGE